MIASYAVVHGPAIETLKNMPDNSIDSCVTDPPYGLSKEPDIREVLSNWLADEKYEHRSAGFQGRQWDSFVSGPEYWAEVYRVLKPGAYLVAFGGTRTVDLLTIAIRMAGFEIRDQIGWIYSQGFPKSTNISKQINKASGEEREDVAAPATEAAKRWEGWGSALKPAIEPIVVARKPFDGPLYKNVLEHGTGALNIDGCRIVTSDNLNGGAYSATGRPKDVSGETRAPVGAGMYAAGSKVQEGYRQPTGRWPANIVLSHAPDCVQVGTTEVEARVINRFVDGAKPFGNGAGHKYETVKTSESGTESVPVFECVEGCAVRELNEQSGTTKPKAGRTGRRGGSNPAHMSRATGDNDNQETDGTWPADPGGGATRFFNTFEYDPEIDPFLYYKKASGKDRNLGMPDGEKNPHPTVKPVTLMAHLCRLVTPPGGTILDPFLGSGSTGVAAAAEGFNFIGIELEQDSADTAAKRIGRAYENPDHIRKFLGKAK